MNPPMRSAPLVRAVRRRTRLGSAVAAIVIAAALLPSMPAHAAGQATVTMSGSHNLTAGPLPDGVSVFLEASFQEQVRYPISAPGRGTIQGTMRSSCGGGPNRPSVNMAASFTLTGPSRADFQLATSTPDVSTNHQSNLQMTVHRPIIFNSSFDDYAVGFNWVPGTVLTRHVRTICRYANVSYPFVATAYDRHALN